MQMVEGRGHSLLLQDFPDMGVVLTIPIRNDGKMWLLGGPLQIRRFRRIARPIGGRERGGGTPAKNKRWRG